MKRTDFTVDHLKQLPLRAIVAFAARCARRVEHLALLPEGHPQRDRRREAVEGALRMAEGFARASTTTLELSAIEAIEANRNVAGTPLCCDNAVAAAAEAARAAAGGWHFIGTREHERNEPRELKTVRARKYLGDLEHATADLAALDAFTAAAEAFRSVGYHNDAFVAAALGDYDRLLRLKLGSYPELGDPVDPSPGGPLGPF
jgi:hypothetical protein